METSAWPPAGSGNTAFDAVVSLVDSRAGISRLLTLRRLTSSIPNSKTERLGMLDISKSDAEGVSVFCSMCENAIKPFIEESCDLAYNWRRADKLTLSHLERIVNKTGRRVEELRPLCRAIVTVWKIPRDQYPLLADKEWRKLQANLRRQWEPFHQILGNLQEHQICFARYLACVQKGEPCSLIRPPNGKSEQALYYVLSRPDPQWIELP